MATVTVDAVPRAAAAKLSPRFASRSEGSRTNRWWHFPQRLRSRMTAGSATLLPFSVAGLNFVWDYPWLGVFSASTALLVVGFVLNTIFRPRLEVWPHVPPYVIAGHSFSVPLRATNRSRFACLGCEVRNDDAPKHRGLSWVRYTWIQRLPREKTHTFRIRHEFAERGIHRLPALQMVSHFPFGLFRTLDRVELPQSIHVIPAASAISLPENMNQNARFVGSAAGTQSAGPDVSQVLSREYEYGMSVTRWDYRAWARLGRPIVRQATSTMQPQWILAVDVSHLDASTMDRLLSAAAFVIDRFEEDARRLHMVYLGGHATPSSGDHLPSSRPPEIFEEPLAQRRSLAWIQSDSCGDATQELGKLRESHPRLPVLLLTASPAHWNASPVDEGLTILDISDRRTAEASGDA